MKALTFIKGMKSLQKAAFSTTYQNVWCAGQSIEHVHEIKSVKQIVEQLTRQGNG
jgi:nitronate monooxygenase